MKLSRVKDAVALLEGYVRLHESPNNPIPIHTATGFFYQDENGIFLITNEHVLRDTSFIKASAHTREKWVHLELWDNGEKLWKHSEEMDLAALKIPRDKLDKLGWRYECFKRDDIFSKNVLTDERIDLGMPILVLGYPKGFCDGHNYDPIA